LENEGYRRWVAGFHRHRLLLVLLTAAACLLAAARFPSIPVDNDIGLMLPEDPELHRALDFLRESAITDKLVIFLALDSPPESAAAGAARLLDAADDLAGRLASPLVGRVVTGFPEADFMEETLSLLRWMPQLLGEEALLKAEALLAPEAFRRVLRRNTLRLFSPAGAFSAPLMRIDPLGIGSGLLAALQSVTGAFGFDVAVEAGHLVSRDRRHALIILETPVKITDGLGSKRLIGHVREQLNTLPAGVTASLIGGHLHTVSNEEVIRSDIRLTIAVASAGFLLLFLAVFRDPRAVLIFLVPIVSVSIAVQLASWTLGKLSYFIIGMGAVVAGISVDYGIHVYTAARCEPGRIDAAGPLIRPLVTAGATTLAVFCSFFFSSVQGYHQLAVFSIFTILLCLAASLFLLPAWLTGVGRLPWRAGSEAGRPGPRADRLRVSAWGALLLAALVSASGVGFETDIRQFDGSSEAVFEAEEAFFRVWGGKLQPAVLVVPASSLEEALEKNEAAAREAEAVLGPGVLIGLSPLWPSLKTRMANAERWNRFWGQGGEARLKALLEGESASHPFSREAFQPFFEQLHRKVEPGRGPADAGILKPLRDRFVVEREGEVRMLSYFPDDPRLIDAVGPVLRRVPGAFVVSRTALAGHLSRAVSSEMVFLAGLAALLVPALTFLLMRSLRLSAIALAAPASGVAAVAGILPLLGLPLNAPSLVALLVVVGLCIDYGIFVVFSARRPANSGTRLAVSLSAITTLVGTGALLLARHPVLFSSGVTLSAGVLAGYLSSLLVLPALCRRWSRPSAGEA